MRVSRQRSLAFHLVLLLGISAIFFSGSGNHKQAVLYVPWYLSDSIGAFRLEQTHAVPLPGSPFPGGVSPIAAVTHPSGFLYVANTGTVKPGGVSAYRMENEGLEELPGSPFETGGAFSLGLDPGGQFLYAFDVTNSIAGFSIEPSGTLRPLPGSPFPLETGLERPDVVGPNLIVVEHTWLMVGYPGLGILVYDRDPDDGSLGRLPRSTARREVSWLAFSPRSSLVYGGHRDVPGIFAYSVQPDGDLLYRPEAGIETEWPRTAGVLSADGCFLYVGSGLTESYRVGPAGSLRRLQELRPPRGHWQVFSMQLVGSFLAVRDISEGVLIYSVDPDSGLLTYVTTIPAPPATPGKFRVR